MARKNVLQYLARFSQLQEQLVEYFLDSYPPFFPTPSPSVTPLFTPPYRALAGSRTHFSNMTARTKNDNISITRLLSSYRYDFSADCAPLQPLELVKDAGGRTCEPLGSEPESSTTFAKLRRNENVIRPVSRECVVSVGICRRVVA